MSQDASQESKPQKLEDVFGEVLKEAEAEEKKFDELKRKEELIREAKEKCYPVRYVVVCEGDEVAVSVGRYWYIGTVIKVGKLGLVLENNNRVTGIALGKIGTIQIVKESELRKKWKETFGEEIDRRLE